MHEETRRAVDALGKGLGRDWILEPQKHASSLPAEAGALQRILVTKPVQQTISRFKLHDEAAGPAQKTAFSFFVLGWLKK